MDALPTSLFSLISRRKFLGQDTAAGWKESAKGVGRGEGTLLNFQLELWFPGRECSSVGWSHAQLPPSPPDRRSVRQPPSPLAGSNE